MKLKRGLFIALLLFGVFSLKAQTIRVATYNMRNDNNSQDSTQGNGWKQRYPVISELIQFHDFDIFGTQELLYHQIIGYSAKNFLNTIITESAGMMENMPENILKFSIKKISSNF